jgi:hypothetical protein
VFGTYWHLPGEVKVVGYTDAPIPWPLGKLRDSKGIIVFKDLVRAIRHEGDRPSGAGGA